MNRKLNNSQDSPFGKQWETWDQLCAEFIWTVPEKMNAAYFLCDAHAKHGNKVAILHEDSTGKKGKITYRELKNITNKLANSFTSRGLKKGDYIAICLSQRTEAIISHIAAWKIGCVSVPVTILIGTDGLQYRLDHSGAKLAIVEAAILDTFRSVRPELESLKHVLVVGDTELDEDESDFWECINEMSARFAPVVMHSDDNLILAFTGGTTGVPKAVVHRHSLLFKAPCNMISLCNDELLPNDIFWNPADYAWAGPLFDLVLPVFYYGKTLLTYSANGKFDPEKAFKLIEDYRLSNLLIPPTGLRMMKQVPGPGKKFNLDSVRVVSSGSESFGKALPEWIKKTFGDKTVVHEIYGQSEGTYLTFNCQKYFEYKYNIGRASPGLVVEIIDDDGNRVPWGETGEIAIQAFDNNPVLFKEYLKDPQGTASKFSGNWMLTGDLGTKDDQGYFTFIGRKDDIIISSGYRIGPCEIEDTLTKHPSVAEAGVIGVPDETRGQIPKAFIVLKEGVQGTDTLKNELRNFVKQRLAKYEYPRKIDFIETLPKTTTGKIKRGDLRRQNSLDIGKYGN